MFRILTLIVLLNTGLNLVNLQLFENQISYFKNLLTFFKDFTFILHTDGNEKFTDKLAEYISLTSDVIIYNKHASNYNPIRPLGLSVVNLVLLNDPWDYSIYMSHKKNVTGKDVVIFMLFDTSTYLIKEDKCGFWTMDYLELAGRILVINFESTATSLYNVCYYCGKMTNTLNLIENTNSSKVNVKSTELLPATYNNFGGHFFLVAYNIIYPYAFCTKVEKTIQDDEIVNICHDLKGSEAVALKKASQILNFTYKLINYENKSIGFIINKVLNGSVDFAIGGITKTQKRNQKVSFVTSLAFENNHLLYVYADTKTHLFNLLKAFDPQVWILLIAVLISTQCFVYVLVNFGKKIKPTYKTGTSSINICIRAILEQSTYIPPNTSHRKSFCIFFAFLWLGYVGLNTMYKSKMASAIIKQSHNEPKNLEELINDGYNVVFERSSSKPLQDIINYSNQFLSIKSRLFYIQGGCNAMAYVMENKTAIMAEYTYLQYQIRFNCPLLFRNKSTLKQKIELLRITRQSFVSTQNGWPIKKEVPYHKSLKHVLFIMHSAGLLNKWYSATINKHRLVNLIPFSKDSSVNVTPMRLDINSCQSAFIILFCGHTAATACFVVEIILKYYYTNSRK